MYKNSEKEKLLLNLAEKMNEKEMLNILHCQVLVKTIRGKMQTKLYKNNTFKLSGPTWDKDFELPDELYSVSGIHDCF